MIKKKRHVTKFPNQVIQSRMELGNSLAVQWLGLCTSLQRAQVQSLVEELRSRKPQGAPPLKKKDGVKFRSRGVHCARWTLRSDGTN